MGTGASTMQSDVISVETQQQLDDLQLSEETMRELEGLRAELERLRLEAERQQRPEGTWMGETSVRVPAQTRRRARSRSPIWSVDDTWEQLERLPANAFEEIRVLHNELETLRRTVQMPEERPRRGRWEQG